MAQLVLRYILWAWRDRLGGRVAQMTLAFRQSAADRIAELENEVDWLRDQLGLRDEPLSQIACGLKVSPQGARVLMMLYAAGGKWVAADWIDANLPLLNTTERIRKNMVVYVWQLRKAIGADAIETRGLGVSYALRVTTVGADRVREALG